MLEGKDNLTLDIVIPFVGNFIGCATDLVEKRQMSRVHNIYSNLVGLQTGYKGCRKQSMWKEKSLQDM